MSADVVIVGGGVNGLVAACTLAKGGRQVTVLEARDRVGGVARREAFHEGFHAPGVLQETAGFRADVATALDLGRFGLKRRSVPTTWAAAAGGGVHIHADGRLEGDVEEGDQERFHALRSLVERLTPAIRSLVESPAPDPQGPLPPLIGAAWSIRRLGKADLIALTRVAPMCVADWMRDSLTTERLRAALAHRGLLGSFMGPWSAGSAANLLLRWATEGEEVEGGPAGVAETLERAAEAYGVTIRTSTAAERILVRGGRAYGVTLADGEEVSANDVVSALDPRRTFLDLVGEEHLTSRFAHDLSSWRCRGVTAALRLALAQPLRPEGGDPVEALAIGATTDDLERAFDAAKHRRPFADRLAMTVRQPSLSDPGLAPADRHVATALIHGVPFHVDGGWTDDRRAALGDAAVAALEEHCPGVGDQVLGRQVLTPADLSERHGLTGGHLFHGEHAPDQLLFLRPHRTCARHATPIDGLWLCGAGAHSGGGVTGGPGLLAARAMLA